MIEPKSPTAKLIAQFQSETLLMFKPTKQFYMTIGINRIRFSQLVKGNKRPDSEEIKSLSAYFSKFFPLTPNDLLA